MIQEVKQRVRVQVADLQLGMYVAELDRPWLETPFLFQGFVVSSNKDLKALRETCKFVFVDADRSVAQERGSVGPRSMAHRATLRGSGRKRTPQRPYTAPFEEEMKAARKLHKRAKAHILGTHDDVRLGRTVDTLGAKHLVNGLVDSIMRNPDALTWMTRLKRKDEYTAQHSLNVCILALNFARHLGLEDGPIREVGLGAFMHDIGKLRVPLEVLNKPGKLSDGEFELMKKHPQYGRDLLERSGGVLPSTLDIAFSHHERASGQGYPRGLQGEEISLFARIVSIVDIYDAISSDRVYHRGLSPQDTMKRLYEGRGRNLDTELVEQFIQAMGVYPVGSLVELNSREIAMVVSALPQSRLQPKVLVVTNAEQKKILPHRLVDLVLEQEQGVGGLSIRRILEPGAFGIDVKGVAADHKGLLM